MSKRERKRERERERERVQTVIDGLRHRIAETLLTILLISSLEAQLLAGQWKRLTTRPTSTACHCAIQPKFKMLGSKSFQLSCALYELSIVIELELYVPTIVYGICPCHFRILFSLLTLAPTHLHTHSSTFRLTFTHTHKHTLSFSSPPLPPSYHTHFRYANCSRQALSQLDSVFMTDGNRSSHLLLDWVLHLAHEFTSLVLMLPLWCIFLTNLVCLYVSSL